MKKPTLTVAGAMLAAVLLGACSDSGTGSTGAPTSPPATTETATDEPETDAPEASPDDETGTQDEVEAPAPPVDQEPLGEIVGHVEVAGTIYDITEVRRCDPLQMEMLDRELEVQGFGVHGGERVQIDVYVQEVAGQRLDEVSWAGPEGVYGGPEGASVSFDGDTVSGSATLVDGLTQESTLAVSFDLEVPSEILDCR